MQTTKVRIFPADKELVRQIADAAGVSEAQAVAQLSAAWRGWKRGKAVASAKKGKK